MYSHHSHSGDYVAHATDTLELITQRAIDLNFKTFCLTEHMPRLNTKYLYPEEIERQFTIDTLKDNFANYVEHARRIQRANKGKGTTFLVGLEVEGLDTEHIDYTSSLRDRFGIDMVVGSVHYVHGIPIDFDRSLWEKARDQSGGIHGLFKDYFELQYQVLTTLKPEVVGHFDLIRLFLKDDDIDPITGKSFSELSIEKDWPDIWELVVRNLKFIRSYGGLVELNSAAIRKKWSTPYPRKDIAEAVIKYADGRFCLSDDSHSVAQVGLNYDKVLTYITEELDLQKVYYLNLDEQGKVKVESATIEDVKNNEFWKQYPL